MARQRERDKVEIAPEAAEFTRNAADGLTARIREAKIVDEELLKWALHEQRVAGGDLCTLLISRAPAVERALWRIQAANTGMEFDDLSGRRRDSELASLVPSHIAYDLKLAPLELRDDILVVAVSSPAALLELDAIAATAGCDVAAVLSPPSDLAKYIQSIYGLGAETVDRLANVETDSDHAPISIVAAESHSIGDSLDSDQQASITRFVNQILIQAVKDGASDIHIEPYEQHLRVRFRIDGQLQEVPVPPTVKQFESSIISRVKVLASLDIAEKRLCQDGQMRLKVLGRSVDVRVSVLPTIYGEGVVLRLLDRQVQFRNIDSIGMAPEMLDRYMRRLELAQGLILVTGPTGSGKTTTLYSSMMQVNRPRRKIITIEDPVEYRLEGITQIQVKESIGLSFSNLLRNILRHDPDVIMVGEVRDRETADMALSASMTGHLVFASLHTNDAPSAVSRLRNMGAAGYMIAAGLELVLAQRLVRRICPDCRQEYRIAEPVVLRQFPRLTDMPVVRGRGCENCRFTGYQGRVALFEFMPMDDTLRRMVLAGDSAAEMHAHAAERGMVPLRRAGIDQVLEGRTTIDEVLRVTGHEGGDDGEAL